MKKGVSLKFSSSGKINIDFSESVEGFDSTIQNSIVNLVTTIGSDTFYSKKGTDLRNRLLEGGMYVNNAQHICNFAMSNTRSFINENNIDAEFIGDAALDCQINTAKNGVELKIHSTSTDGNNSKFTWPL